MARSMAWLKSALTSRSFETKYTTLTVLSSVAATKTTDVEAAITSGKIHRNNAEMELIGIRV
jgi:hypothetical protein